MRVRAATHVVIASLGIAAVAAVCMYGAIVVLGQSAGASLGQVLKIVRPQAVATKGDREAGVSRLPKTKVTTPSAPIIIPLPPPTSLMWEGRPLQRRMWGA